MPAARKEPPKLPEDSRLVKKWRDLLDPQKTSIRDFCAFYKVPTKKVALVGGKSLVPFRERPGQTKQRETIEKQWSEGHGGKLIGGKGRQEGWTTSAALLFWERFMRGGGGTWNLFSYDDDAVKELFRLFQSFRKQTPTWVFACLIRGGGGVWKKSSSKQLELEFPDGEQNAMLQCLTAGDKNSGSGSAPRGVLWDEFTKWKTEAKQDPTSMSEGWQDAPGNLFIIQFTGQGNEEGAKLFMDAYAGRGESGFVALFIPWLGHPDRTVNVADHEIDALKGSIGKERVYGPKDEMEMMNAGATLGEIRWRRRKLSGPGFQWNLSLFKREYPLVPSDMFISSSRTIFHDQEEILKSHVVPAEARHRAAVTGELRQGTQGEGWIVFDEYINGPWTIYEYPEDGCQYVFGADATSGKQVVAQGNGEPDYAFCTIDKLWTGETVACYRGHTEGRKFGNEVFNGAMFYNNARGFVESNTYGQAVIYRIMEMSFGPLNAVVEGRDLLMTHVQSISQRTGMASMIEEIGFTTGPKTKELLIDCIRAWLIEVGLYDPEKGATMPHQFVQEALLFERNPKTGGASARQGHDDAVMSKGLCLFAREETFRRGEVDVQTRVNRRPTLDPIEEFYRAVAKQNDTKRGKAGQSPHLGAAF